MSGAALPAASVVVRCRDEAAHLGAVLEEVFLQRDAPPFEVVALDSGSRDGTLALLKRFPVRVAHLPEFTYGRALNHGAALARADLVVYLSAHCRPLDQGWLGALLAPFDQPDVVATFGRQVPVLGVNPIEAITTRRNFPAQSTPGVRFSTANGAVRRAAVLARGFDEEIAIAEDHLWACGVGAGERIAYVPEASVAHSHPMSLRAWGARFYAHGLAAEYARRRRGVALPWGEADDGVGRVVTGRAGAFVRLAATLVREGQLAALAQLPSYALARTLWYTRGLRDGARRYASDESPAAVSGGSPPLRS